MFRRTYLAANQPKEDTTLDSKFDSGLLLDQVSEITDGEFEKKNRTLLIVMKTT